MLVLDSPFGEPAASTAEPAGCLAGSRRHEEESKDADHEREQPFNEEQIPPSRVPLETTQVEDAVRKEGR